MTHYLHKNKLFNIDRMPPEDDFHWALCDCDGCGDLRKEWHSFNIYLSTLTPIPHELKGEGIKVEGKDFEWRYEYKPANGDWRTTVDLELFDSIVSSQKRRVAVPIEAKEQAAPQQTDEEYRGVEYWKQLAINDGRMAIQHLEQILQLQKKIEQLSSQTLQQHPAKETMLEQLADLLKKYDVRKYLNLNDSGYSQVERDIVDLFAGNPVAKELKQIRDAFQWTFDNMGTPHTSDHFNVPANAIEQLDKLIALFTSQHGEQETENKWMEAGLRLVAELYKKHRFILKNLDVANEDKNIFLYRLGISTEYMDNH